MYTNKYNIYLYVQEEYPEDTQQNTSKKSNESPVKNAARNSKAKSLKKGNPKNAKAKKDSPSKKEPSPPKKVFFLLLFILL